MEDHAPKFCGLEDIITKCRPFQNIDRNWISFYAIEAYRRILNEPEPKKRINYNRDRLPKKGQRYRCWRINKRIRFHRRIRGRYNRGSERLYRCMQGIGDGRCRLMVGDMFYVDAEFRGNFTRLINHSCDPNSFYQFIIAHILMVTLKSKL